MHSPRRILSVLVPLFMVLVAGVARPLEVERATVQDDSLSVDLAWETESGWQYWLAQSDDLSTWNMAGNMPTVGSGQRQRTQVQATGNQAFFRVSTEPDQRFNLAVPEDGTRYDSYAEFDGPRWPETYGDGHVTLWHKGKFAAYSITIDDNNTPDIPWWQEVSDTYGWKLTWFVIVHPYVWNIYQDEPGSNQSYFGTLKEWADLHEAGHDIQLHGACSAMNTLTAEEYEDHIIRSIEVLGDALGKRILTYAYPCGRTRSEDGQHNYREIISRKMIAARGTSGGVTPVHLLDYLGTNSLGGNALSDGNPSRLFGRYNDRRNFQYSQYRGWCVTLYHGMKDAGKASAINTFDWVKAREDQFWVAPFTDVAKYAQQRESATLNISSASPDRITLTVTDLMDDTVFDHPLTVKIRVDQTWSGIDATQSGNPVTAYLVDHEGARYAYVEPVPDRGEVVLTRN